MDANAITDLNNKTEEGILVLEWLLSGKGALVVGGKLRTELGHSKQMAGTMRVLNQAGLLHSYDDTEVQALANKMEAQCRSNDAHVVALAIISECELVFSRDGNLHRDLKNRKLIGHKVSIYQTTDHDILLTECKRGRRN